jgi:hypothetical protein
MTLPGSRLEMRASSAVIALALVGALVSAGSARAGAGAPCRVTNLTTAHVYVGGGPNLQVAIDAARGGTSLRVRGVCVGTYTVGKNLRLVGWATVAFPRPTLDGDHAGTVLTVAAGRVVVQDLTITHGDATEYFGGGIDNESVLTLAGATSVSHNVGAFGSGGIFNGGSLTLNGTSSVWGNGTDSGGAGGGIYNDGDLMMNGRSSVRGNTAGFGGGVYSNCCTIAMHGRSFVSGNTSTSYGAGILSRGRLMMNGRSSVRGNTSVGDAGGIFNADLAHLAMAGDASVRGNVAGGEGGGIFNEIFGHLKNVVAGVNVVANQPDDIFQEEK